MPDEGSLPPELHGSWRQLLSLRTALRADSAKRYGEINPLVEDLVAR
jgi:hypothetical protein